MIDVDILIWAIVLYSDESILGLNIGNGYSIKKMYLKELPFKSRITNNAGDLTINYLGSVREDDCGKYFICVEKHDTYQLPLEKGGAAQIVLDEKEVIIEGKFSNQMESFLQLYRDNEKEYLHKMFSLLRIYKAGNIGIKELFIQYGREQSTRLDTIDNVGRNVIDRREFALSPCETMECNHFLENYADTVYPLLKNCIDRYIWGLEQIDESTGFELIMSTLEMALLSEKEDKKIKENLSRRTAILLSESPEEQQILYKKMRSFYKCRSKSLHCGNDDSISQTALFELQETVRLVLIKLFKIYKEMTNMNPTITACEAKSALVHQLKGKVDEAIENGLCFDDAKNQQ